MREVLGEGHDAVLDIGVGLFLRGREVHRTDETPVRTLGRVTVLGRDFVPRLPVRADRVEALPGGRRDREQTGVVLAGWIAPVGEIDAATATSMFGSL